MNDLDNFYYKVHDQKDYQRKLNIFTQWIALILIFCFIEGALTDFKNFGLNEVVSNFVKFIVINIISFSVIGFVSSFISSEIVILQIFSGLWSIIEQTVKETINLFSSSIFFKTWHYEEPAIIKEIRFKNKCSQTNFISNTRNSGSSGSEHFDPSRFTVGNAGG